MSSSGCCVTSVPDTVRSIVVSVINLPIVVVIEWISILLLLTDIHAVVDIVIAPICIRLVSVPIESIVS